MDCNYGLLSTHYGLLEGMVAYYFGLLAFPARQRKLHSDVPGLDSKAAAGRNECNSKVQYDSVLKCFVEDGAMPMHHGASKPRSGSESSVTRAAGQI